MRKVLIVILGFATLGALSYISHSPPDCVTQLSRCVSDPPLFARLQGMDVRAYCQSESKACGDHNARITAQTAAERAAARQRAANASFFNAF